MDLKGFSCTNEWDIFHQKGKVFSYSNRNCTCPSLVLFMVVHLHVYILRLLRIPLNIMSKSFLIQNIRKLVLHKNWEILSHNVYYCTPDETNMAAMKVYVLLCHWAVSKDKYGMHMIQCSKVFFDKSTIA